MQQRILVLEAEHFCACAQPVRIVFAEIHEIWDQAFGGNIVGRCQGRTFGDVHFIAIDNELFLLTGYCGIICIAKSCQRGHVSVCFRSTVDHNRTRNHHQQFMRSGDITGGNVGDSHTEQPFHESIERDNAR